MVQNPWDAAQAALKGNWRATKAYLTKQEKPQKNTEIFHRMEPEQQQEPTPVGGRK